MINTSTRSYGY